MEFKCRIEMDNAAFEAEPGRELASLLKFIAMEVVDIHPAGDRGALTEAMIPDDYMALTSALVGCATIDDHVGHLILAAQPKEVA